MNTTLEVTEIFHSIQGESTLAGRPCVFVRLAGCNLHCHWCDTRYASDESGENIQLSDVVQMAMSYNTDLACITGGEPLLQSGVSKLVGELIESGLVVQVETNGSMDISALPDGARRIMDIKCPDSGENGSTLESNFSELNSSDELKFVIASRRDFDWAIQKVRNKSLCEICPVLFSPVDSDGAGISPATLADWVLRAGLPVRLQLQLHRIIWPERERGV